MNNPKWKFEFQNYYKERLYFAQDRISPGHWCFTQVFVFLFCLIFFMNNSSIKKGCISCLKKNCKVKQPNKIFQQSIDNRAKVQYFLKVQFFLKALFNLQPPNYRYRLNNDFSQQQKGMLKSTEKQQSYLLLNNKFYKLLFSSYHQICRSFCQLASGAP